MRHKTLEKKSEKVNLYCLKEIYAFTIYPFKVDTITAGKHCIKTFIQGSYQTSCITGEISLHVMNIISLVVRIKIQVLNKKQKSY